MPPTARMNDETINPEPRSSTPRHHQDTTWSQGFGRHRGTPPVWSV